MDATKYIRVYQELDINQVRDHLLIYGDLSGSCAKCRNVDIKLSHNACPHCQSEFHYIAFRNIRHHLPKLHQLRAERPAVIFVDYEDFSRTLGAQKAEEFLK